MELKELLRVAITEEMADISVYEVEAETFDSRPEHGAAIAALFFRLANEKRERLKTLRRISGSGIGFRQRNTEPARSPEAALRLHITRAEKAFVHYAALAKELNNPEFVQAASAIALEERRYAADLRELQALIKTPAR